MWSLGLGAGLIALGVPVAVCIGLAADETWFGVFVKAFNPTDGTHTSANDFQVEDTVGKRYAPVRISGDNVFAYFAGPEELPLEYTSEVLQIDAGADGVPGATRHDAHREGRHRAEHRAQLLDRDRAVEAGRQGRLGC